MNIKITGYTQPNSGVSGTDTDYMRNGPSTAIDTIVEYAARVCYKSTKSMGRSPSFIQHKLVQSGHHDVIEHGWLVLSIMGLDFGQFTQVLWWKHIVPYLEYFTPHGYHNEVLIAGNVRAWRMLVESGVLDEETQEAIVEHLARIAPMCVEDLVLFGEPKIWADRPMDVDIPSNETPSGARVSMLGATTLPSTCPDNLCHATFLFEGVSRSLTHQLVRHRVGSFSQESQRYVDLEKGDWGYVTPPNFENAPHAKQDTEHFWNIIRQSYQQLRKAGVRKEDARFVLPNMTETRLVVSMPLHGWRHFFKLRCAKDAQWEIRWLAKTALLMMDKAFPGRFDYEMEEFHGVKRHEPKNVQGRDEVSEQIPGNAEEERETGKARADMPRPRTRVGGMDDRIRSMGHSSLEDSLMFDLSD